MKAKLRQWSKTAIVYVVVIVLSIATTHFYYELETNRYIRAYKEAGGDEVLSNISDMYKRIMENYSNYKLGRDTKMKIIRELETMQEQLEEVDTTINHKRPIRNKIDFAIVYHDMKLVRLSLSDATKDDIVPVIVLHASEGLKELEKEITYIEFR